MPWAVSFLNLQEETHLHLELLHEIPEDCQLRQDWNALVQRMERPEVFYTYEWALAMQRAYRATLVPLLALAYEGGALVGVTALATDPSRQEVAFLSATTADYCDFLSAPCHRRAVIEAVVSRLQSLRICRIRVANLPADSASSKILKNVCRRYGLHIFSRVAYRCAEVFLGSQNERENRKAGLFGKKIRRYLTVLERQGPVTIEHLKDFGEIEEALPQFSKAHVARFLATGRISNLARPERRLFLRELADLLSQSGSLTLTRLMAGDRPVAWNYGFQFAGSWFWYQPTFDSKFEQYSPGICLLSKVIAEACENPDITRVDLGLGTEGYKDRFANGARETLHLTLTASRSRHLKEVVRYRAAALVKTKPEIERTTRWGLSKLKYCSRRLNEAGLVNTVLDVAKRVRAGIFGSQEAVFYEWQSGWCSGNVKSTGMVSLQPLALDHLAAAAMEFFDDTETLHYLLRCADRLRSSDLSGYALVRSNGTPVAFAWVSPPRKLPMRPGGMETLALRPDAMLLFDSWTPKSRRGRGFAEKATQSIADDLAKQNRTLWICVSGNDADSVKSMEESGFQRRHSTHERKVLFYRRVEIRDAATAISRAEVPVAS